jgi:hypothetical protein
MAQSHAVQSAKLVLNTNEQKLESVQRVLATVLGRGGCPGCGRLAVLEVQFASNPDPTAGVISMTTVE